MKIVMAIILSNLPGPLSRNLQNSRDQHQSSSAIANPKEKLRLWMDVSCLQKRSKEIVIKRALYLSPHKDRSDFSRTPVP